MGRPKRLDGFPDTKLRAWDQFIQKDSGTDQGRVEVQKGKRSQEKMTNSKSKKSCKGCKWLHNTSFQCVPCLRGKFVKDNWAEDKVE